MPFQIQAEMLFIGRAVGILAGMTTQLDPEFDPWAKSIPYARVFAKEELKVSWKDLPEEIRQAFPKPVVNADAVQPLNEIEEEYIVAVLKLNGGNQTRTAEQLGIGSATLYRKLKSYGLTRTRRAKK